MNVLTYCQNKRNTSASNHVQPRNTVDNSCICFEVQRNGGLVVCADGVVQPKTSVAEAICAVQRLDLTRPCEVVLIAVAVGVR